MSQAEATPTCDPTTVDTARLPFCPMCEYDLTGLPARHRCPECSCEYDECTRVWLFRKRDREIWGQIVSLLMIFLCFVVNALFLSAWGSSWLWGYAGLGVFVVWQAVYTYRRRGRWGMVAVTPLGLVVRDGPKKAVVYFWKKLELVEGRRPRIFWCGGRFIRLSMNLKLEGIVRNITKHPDFWDTVRELKRRSGES